MKALPKTAVAMFGGAAALALVVGFGGIGAGPVGGASATTTHPSSSVTPAPTHAANTGVHAATLTGCIAGLDC
jgi:hypothetical protein